MITYLALMAYIVALCHIIFFLVHGGGILKSVFNVFFGLGLIINIIQLILKWYDTGNLFSGMYDFMNISSAAFAAAYFILYSRYRKPLVGLFICPFNVIFAAIAILIPPSASYPFVNSVWRYGHLPFVILGSAFFIASFVASVMYIIQKRQLKGKNFGFIFQRFPPLDTINKINSSSLHLGFYFFTIGIALGFAWILDGSFKDMMTSPKVVFSLVSWVIFALIMWLQHFKKVSPSQIANLTVMGFCSIIITYIGVAKLLVG